MGIPFYFASLLKSHAGIVTALKRGTPMNVDVLAVDFNCLIHRYLQDDRPVQSIIEALKYILENVCKAKTVLIALDGLVPYAKIVQQRYRRMRIREETGEFDRHQISPDTPFMRELEHELSINFPMAILSPTREPGEGEHKLIGMLSAMDPSKRRSVCIYGLDADLILIALKNHALSYPHSMSLLRESAEFNDPKLKHAEFATLSIWKLLREIPMDISQYIALSVLCFGNDFMPNLGMFSLREDGYDRALYFYTECGRPDLTTASGRHTFLKYAAEREMDTLKERINLRKRPEEKALLGKNPSLFSRKYYRSVLDGVQDVTPVVEAYWKTFHWTYDLFMTSEIKNWSWMYPYSDAPLVCDIVKHSETEYAESELNYNVTQQLQCILPVKSLRSAKRRVVFPDELHTETRNPWMKRHDWEMKPRISIPWNPDGEFTTVETL